MPNPFAAMGSPAWLEHQRRIAPTQEDASSVRCEFSQEQLRQRRDALEVAAAKYRYYGRHRKKLFKRLVKLDEKTHKPRPVVATWYHAYQRSFFGRKRPSSPQYPNATVVRFTRQTSLKCIWVLRYYEIVNERRHDLYLLSNGEYVIDATRTGKAYQVALDQEYDWNPRMPEPTHFYSIDEPDMCASSGLRHLIDQLSG